MNLSRELMGQCTARLGKFPRQRDEVGSSFDWAASGFTLVVAEGMILVIYDGAESDVHWVLYSSPEAWH